MKQPNDVKRPNSGGGSLAQFLRSREKFIHVSKTLEVVWAEQIGGDVRRFGCVEFLGVSPDPGKVRNIGRNAAKRAHRASKTSRKHWRKVA
ncbi:hypothetical protein [Noviluteimonas gilva]|uniref:Uncharacterized protein n=1 Tax=Noviluteimonas gilva TaxID=2682097 RepID=A0A7C9M2R9_9GAMM|nr:hypothetical protein [Lysobacter gilvus]MUV13562.1 hypothetical protein [Lysobacter gilvus]